MTGQEICGCCDKMTVRTEEERKKLIHRLNRIEGQIRGIRGMVEGIASTSHQRLRCQRYP